MLVLITDDVGPPVACDRFGDDDGIGQLRVGDTGTSQTFARDPDGDRFGFTEPG